MSFKQRTSSGRPRLSLPGFKVAPPTTRQEQPFDGQPARLPLPLGKLSKAYHARMIAELGQVLGVHVEALPRFLCGRVPVALRIGIRDDVATRYPNADAEALGRWLRRWTNTDAYLVAVAAGGNRFDLDGAPCGEIVEKEAAHARERLARRHAASTEKTKPAAG